MNPPTWTEVPRKSLACPSMMSFEFIHDEMRRDGEWRRKVSVMTESAWCTAQDIKWLEATCMQPTLISVRGHPAIYWLKYPTGL